MLKVGITGNIASGKTEVENILKNKGYKVICADKLSHDALLDADIRSFVEECFKTSNREELGRIVFSDIDMRKKLEKIIHPFVIKKINEFFKDNQNENVVFACIPLLFEANLQGMFDKIIFVQSDDKIRLNRLIKRNGYDMDYAILRMNAQMPQDEKINKSDFVILNNSDIENLKLEANKVIEALKLLL